MQNVPFFSIGHHFPNFLILFFLSTADLLQSVSATICLCTIASLDGYNVCWHGSCSLHPMHMWQDGNAGTQLLSPYTTLSGRITGCFCYVSFLPKNNETLWNYKYVHIMLAALKPSFWICELQLMFQNVKNILVKMRTKGVLKVKCCQKDFNFFLTV